MPSYGRGGGIERRLDAGASGANHRQIDTQFAAVINTQSCLGSVGIENAGDVVLGVAGGEQHGGYRQHMLDTTLPQGVEALPQDRPRKFQIAILQGHRIQPLPQLIG